MSRRVTRLLFSAVVTIVALVAAACGGAATSAAPASSSTGIPTVGIAKNPQLGSILVDGTGRTLYLFEKDQGGKSSCYGSCAQLWPLLTSSGNPHAGTGVSVSLLSTTSRSDGKAQVTYHRHPLYYYVSDTQLGQVSGEGLNQFGAGWDAVSPQGDKVEKPGA